MLLQSIARKSFAFAIMAGVVAVSLQASDARADGPLSHFAGHWRGTGKITTSNGTKESITCKGVFSVGDAGASLTQTLVCASASYKVNVSSQAQAQGGKLSGTWSETTRNVTGAVTGTINPAGTTVRAIVSGSTFQAGLSLNLSGGGLYVQIKPANVDIVDVSVALRKG